MLRCFSYLWYRMVLLLGASGLLGHNVLRLLLERGTDVRVLLRPGSSLDPSCLASGVLPQPQILRGSLLDFDTLLAASAGCEAIINCAGTTDMRLPRPEDFFPVNRDLPEMLTRVLEAEGRRLVMVE